MSMHKGYGKLTQLIDDLKLQPLISHHHLVAPLSRSLLNNILLPTHPPSPSSSVTSRYLPRTSNCVSWVVGFP
jgi:hypothetical protein